jgi:hypothetical protein
MATGGQTYKAENILFIIKTVTLDEILPVYMLTELNIKLPFIKIHHCGFHN